MNNIKLIILLLLFGLIDKTALVAQTKSDFLKTADKVF